MQPKIVTCCYCGTRAALVLKGDVRHELACSACGAPLNDLKALKAKAKPRSRAGPPTPRRHAPPWPDHVRTGPPTKRRRKRKSLARRVLSEAVDLIEDIFD